MTSETDETLLQENIEEYVNEDNKIVTCKWLSLMHSININSAKRALHVFVDHQRNAGGNDDINVTYFVAGLGKSKDGNPMHKCAVVPESELEVVKKSLSTLTSCHIFSVQKAKLKDYIPLYMTDYEVIKNNLEKCNSFSSIKCPWVSLKSVNPVSKTVQQPVKPENKENAPSSRTEPVSSAPKATAKKAEPKGSIASMFASAPKKEDEGDKSSKSVKKNTAALKTKAPDKKGGMLAFFEKRGDSPTKKDPTPARDSKKVNAGGSRVAESKVSPKEKQEPKRKKKQTADSDDEAPDKKRRRRIRTDLFDSSDEEDADVVESEEEQEENVEHDEKVDVLSDKEDEQIQTSGGDDKKNEEDQEKEKADANVVSETSASSGKKRKRTKKVVTKHYQDEEGFMVTKKETVWESETDDEDEPLTIKQEPTSKTSTSATDVIGKPANKNTTGKPDPKGKTGAKKNSSPQKSKQTSLMSFFKKK